MLVGNYRPDEITTTHLLHPLFSEWKRRHGNIFLNLAEDDRKAFVNDYLDTLPNQFLPAFRQAFFAQTRGHALFTAELLRAMVDEGVVWLDNAGIYHADSDIRWQSLPAKG